MTPKLTDKLYKQLFKVALNICHQKEDNAAECVNKVILNFDKYSAGNSTEEFWGWARKIMKNHQIDLYRSQKNNIKEVELTPNFEEDIVEDQRENVIDEIYQLKEKLSPQQIMFMLNYVSSNRNKTIKEKIMFFRLKKKMLSTPNQKQKKYIVRWDCGKEQEFETSVQIAGFFNLTPEAIRIAMREKRSIKKKGNPKIFKKK